MKNYFFNQLSKKINDYFIFFRPGPNAVKGAGIALMTFTGIIWITLTVLFSFIVRDGWSVTLYLTVAIISILSSLLVIFLIKLLYKIPKFYKRILFAVIPLLFVSFSFNLYVIIYIIIFISLLGAAVGVLIKNKFQNLKIITKIVTFTGLVFGLAGLILLILAYIPPGFEDEEPVNAALKAGVKTEHIRADSPGEKGIYKIKTMTYGSGKDKHRNEYGNDIHIRTDSVDGTPFIDNWRGFGGWVRTKYWGFDVRSLPLNARVWYPEGKGPFPLVLVVHGNHFMRDYSDPGYDYLGVLLASRGIILASVDENFINGAWSDVLGWLKNENDARAWLLLEHLKVWHKWNNLPENIFYGKIDTNNIGLIGHSRGGEAVAHAAFFNKLPFYPDDALVKFDYNFNIRSVIAIAPCDAQYKPSKTMTPLENISYMVLHGSHDGDVMSYMGYRQYERISFSDSLYHFKCGLYIYGANHGQFNSTWGNNDIAHPFTGLLNLKQLLTENDQQQIAKVYISAFLEATLNSRKEFMPLFADARSGYDWLPETIYLNQFEDSKTEYICDFEEDFNLKSTELNENALSGENLSVWKEQMVELKWGQTISKAAVLGWNEKDTLDAIYSIDIDTISFDLDSNSVFCFTMADTDCDPNPRSKGKWINGKNEKEQEAGAGGRKKDKDGKKEPVDFTIRLVDRSGAVVEFPLSRFSYLQRKFKPRIMKTDFIDYDEERDIVFQIFMYPLEDVASENPDFNYKDIQKIEFIFNLTKKGVVMIDKIGFMRNLKT